MIELPRNGQGRIVKKSGAGKKSRNPSSPPLSTPVALNIPGWAQDPIEELRITRHPRDYGMVSILVLRKGVAGFSMASYLVDSWGVGLKSAKIHTGIGRGAWTRLVTEETSPVSLERIELAVAQAYVYGGVAWAKQWGFVTPPDAIRGLAFLPEPSEPVDLSRFGQEGKPLLIINSKGIGRYFPGLGVKELTARGIHCMIMDMNEEPPQLKEIEGM